MGYTKEELEAQRRMGEEMDQYSAAAEQQNKDYFPADYLSQPDTYDSFRMKGVEAPAPQQNAIPSRRMDMEIRK